MQTIGIVSENENTPVYILGGTAVNLATTRCPPHSGHGFIVDDCVSGGIAFLS